MRTIEPWFAFFSEQVQAVSMKEALLFAMRQFVYIMLFAVALSFGGVSVFAQDQQVTPDPAKSDSAKPKNTGPSIIGDRANLVLPPGADPRAPLFDTDPWPEWYPENNPFGIVVLNVILKAPVLDSKGKPHHHGNVIQIIQDGGNGKQDLPKADGSPGGDDSLAIGNYNMLRVMGQELDRDSTKATGYMFPTRYFVPFITGKRYYLRLWEGGSEKTAPYYQDTIEYETDQPDRGGALIMMRNNQLPFDCEWKFGPSKPRPK